MYGDIKSQIFSAFPMSADATLIAIGLCIWLITGLIFRLPMTRLVCVAPLIIIAIAIEIADVMFLAQEPMRALNDFIFLVIPVTILVFFQHQGWARS